MEQIARPRTNAGTKQRRLPYAYKTSRVIWSDIQST